MDFEGFGKRIWADNPQRDERLLDWFDEHPDETKIMFSPSRGRRPRGRLTKNRCYELAANAVFATDEDPALRDQMSRMLIEDSSWKKKYQLFNNEIGASAANTAFDEIEAGSEDDNNIKDQLVYFPLWTRLHVHWRTLPNLNRFYPATLAADEEDDEEAPPDALPTSPPPPKRRRKATKKAAEADRDDSADHEASPDADSDIIEVAGPSNVEDVKQSISENARQIIRRKLSTLKRKRGDTLPSASTSAARIGLTATQKHERELAELAVKLQALENEALEKKTAAELRRLEIEAEERRRIAEHNNQRAKEKHELMMKMVSLAEGKAGAEAL